MSLIDYTLDGKIDKVKIAIDRIRALDPLAHGIMDAPYYVAYSGGKDSDALRILFELAGARFDLVHNHTTVDAPETVYYIRSIPKVQISKPAFSMWDLIVRKRIPPTHIARYCCSILKEGGGKGRFVATGVRWAESNDRKKKRGSLEILRYSADKNIILNADNSENRRLFETCTLKGKRIINPIIDWSDDDVWEFLDFYGCRSNPLYANGFRRVGCVGCPMAGRPTMLKEFGIYPKYKNLYLRAFDRMLIARRADGMPTGQWQNAEDVFTWWTTKPPQPEEIEDLAQVSLWELMEAAL